MGSDRRGKLQWIEFFGTGCVNKRAPKNWAQKVLEELERGGQDPGKDEVERALMIFDWHADFGG